MTLDEAIRHTEEVAEAEERRAKLHQRPDKGVKGSGKRYLSCIKCAAEHRQLAEWLRELKAYREKENCNKPYWAEMEVLTDVYDIMGDKTWTSKMRCSNCNFITYAIEGKFSQYNYCPNCGAKMIEP